MFFYSALVYPFCTDNVLCRECDSEAQFSAVGRTHGLLEENAVWGIHDENGIQQNTFEHVYMRKWARADEDKYAYVKTAEMGDFYIIPTANSTEGTNTERQWFQYSFENDTTVLHMEWNCGPPGNLLQIPIWSNRVCTNDNGFTEMGFADRIANRDCKAF